MKLIKESVGIAGILTLFACSSSAPGGSTNAGSGGSSGSGGGQASGGSSGSGSGGAATGGSSGTGGSTAGTGGSGTDGSTTDTSGAGGTAMPADESVLEKGKRPSRDGNYVQPMLTAAAAAKVMPDTAFNTAASFNGQMYSSPLYLPSGPGGKGIFIAATTNNDVKAFDDTGAPVWTRNFGAVGAGGTFTPKGVMSTPVIDPAAGADGFATIYACAPASVGGAFNHYELHAISAKDGTERAGWPAKLDGTVKAANDGLNRAFVPTNHGQRPALSLVNGVVYVGFGGPYGDFSAYYGWVIAVDTKNPATVGGWSTRAAGGAVWSPGGFASDGNGIIITTGNYWANTGSFSAPAMYGDTESIIRLTGMPTALTRSGTYYPARWRQLDTDDQDFGASSVMILNVPNSTPSSYAVSATKDAHLYFVDSAKLGMDGGGGETIDMTLSTSNHSARVSPVAYTTASGIHVAVTVDRGPYMGCPAMSNVDPAMSILAGFTVTPGSPIKVTQNWCTTIGGPTMTDQNTIKNRSADPLVTTTDGKTDPVLWVGGSTSQAGTGTTASILYAIDGETGAVLYKGGNCPGIRQWTTPIAVKGHIVLGGDGHLCSWSPH